MRKSTCIGQIQKRLPSDIILQDQTPFEFTDDEFIVMLSWIKYFNRHYENDGMNEHPTIQFPQVSKRMYLDFSLYRFPSSTETNKGKHVIYITANGKRLDGLITKNLTVKDLINSWGL